MILRFIGVTALACLVAAAAPAQSQSSVTLDNDIRIFTVAAALNVASSSDGGKFGTDLDPDLVRRLKQYYSARKGSRSDESQYAPYFGLAVSLTNPPEMKLKFREEQLPDETRALLGFQDLLREFYLKAHISARWVDLGPQYDAELIRLRPKISAVLLQTDAYLRTTITGSGPRLMHINVELLAPPNSVSMRVYQNDYFVVLGPATATGTDAYMEALRHAYLHFLVDQVPMMYPHVIAVKRPVYQMAVKAPRLPGDLVDDFPAWFSECTVRAVEIKLKKLSPSEREVVLQNADADGFVLVRPIFQALTGYEQGEPAFTQYFPDLVRGIDAKAEQARVAAIRFAPQQTEAEAKELNKEAVTKRQTRPVTTVSGDQEVIAALTEGEKKISEKNPRAAEAAFQSVLTKNPNETRAWWGLGLVALMDHDADRAKQIFGRLTTGEHAAKNDPMVTAWSHVYLARIYDDEGQLDRARSEYQAAIDVQGAPAQAQQAAQKGLGDLALRKPSERP